MNVLLTLILCCGLFAVGLCFFILMPVVANLLLGLFSIVIQEQVHAKMTNRQPGTDMELD